MLTLFVEVIMSVFIANFKASEHPIINIIVRGVLVGIFAFFLFVFLDIYNKREFNFGWAIILSIVGGIFVTILLYLIEIVCNFIDRK